MIKEFLEDVKSFGGFPIYIFLIVLSAALKYYAFSLELFIALVLCFVVVFGVRAVYFRKRPVAQKYTNAFSKLDASSFPSMHAMRASSLACLLSLFVGSLYAGILFFLWAIITAVVRVVQKRHHVSDVVVGFIVGILIALFCVWFVAKINIV